MEPSRKVITGKAWIGKMDGSDGRGMPGQAKPNLGASPNNHKLGKNTIIIVVVNMTIIGPL